MLNIMGGGGFAREVMNHWLLKNNFPNKQREQGDPYLVNFYVEAPYVVSTMKSLELVHKPEKVKFVVRSLDLIKVGHALIGVGNPYVKMKLSSYCVYTDHLDCSLYNPEVDQQELHHSGIILCPGVSITTNVLMGKCVTVNLNCTIGHDTTIGDFTTINPGVNVSGNVLIGDRCQIGSNAVIKEGVKICDDVVIGAGAVVVKDITEPGIYVGVPARPLNSYQLVSVDGDRV